MSLSDYGHSHVSRWEQSSSLRGSGIWTASTPITVKLPRERFAANFPGLRCSEISSASSAEVS